MVRTWKKFRVTAVLGIMLAAVWCAPTYASSVNSNAGAITVKSSFTMASDLEVSGNFLLIGLSTDKNGSPVELSATWETEPTGWVPSWYIKLRSEKGLIPSGLYTPGADALRFGPVRPVEGHTYVVALSYQPVLGYLSFSLLDQTAGVKVASGVWGVNACADPLFGEVDSRASIVSYPWYEPVGAGWDVGTGKHSDFTPMRLLEPQGENWVRLMATGTLPGEYRILTNSGVQLAHLNGSELVQGENWLPIPSADLPLGESALTLQYLDQGQVRLSNNSEIVVGKIGTTLKNVSLDDSSHSLMGTLVVESQSLLHNVALQLQVSISSITWNSSTASYVPKEQSKLTIDLGRLAVVPVGVTNLPISVAVPEQTGLWRAEFKLFADPAIVVQDVMPTIQFSTYNWILLGNESVTLTTDHSDSVYKVGEPVTFRIRVEQNSKPVDGVSVQYSLTKDGGAVLQSGYAKVENGETRIATTLSEPGFVQLRATYMSGAQSINATAGASVDPTKITPSLPVPDDFDAFWNAKKALLAKVPVNARVKPVFSGEIDVTAYDVEVDALGAPVSGYLAVPKNAKPGSMPAILTFHGAGVDSAILSRSTTWAKDGLIALDINAHGLPNGQPSTYYSNLYAGELANYRFKGRESRDEFYFLGMYLRVIRAIDYLTTRPEWDGRTLILYGTSQGGAQAYAGAGLDPRVTFVVAGESALADLTGLTVNRAMGWPGASLVAAPSAAVQKNITNTVRYFDVMNMATRIKADGFFTVGFLDPTCPPTTVYAAYNNIKANKTIYNDIGAVHQNTSEALSLMREAVLNHVAKMKTSER